MSIRSTFYDLLNHCIPANLILKDLSLNILESTDPSLAPELCSIFAEYVNEISYQLKYIYLIVFLGSPSLQRFQVNFPFRSHGCKNNVVLGKV